MTRVTGSSLAIIVCVIEASHLIIQYGDITDSIVYRAIEALLISDAALSIVLAALLIKRLNYLYSFR